MPTTLWLEDFADNAWTNFTLEQTSGTNPSAAGGIGTFSVNNVAWASSRATYSGGTFTNAAVLMKVRIPTLRANSYLRIALRASNDWTAATGTIPNTCYLFSIATHATSGTRGPFTEKVVSGAFTELNNANTWAPTAGTWYWWRCEALGSTVQQKFWADGASEPASWTFSVTDTSVATAGLVRTNLSTIGLPSAVHTANADDITIYDPAGGELGWDQIAV